MSLVVEVLQGAAAIGTVVFGYVKLSGIQRASAVSLVKRAVLLAAIAAVIGTSVYHVIVFASGDDLPTRKQILWLLVNLWNLVMYLFSGVALLTYFLKTPLHPSGEQPSDPAQNSECQ